MSEEFIVPLLTRQSLILLVFSVCGKEYLGEAVANNALVKLRAEMMWSSLVQADHCHT